MNQVVTFGVAKIDMGFAPRKFCRFQKMYVSNCDRQLNVSFQRFLSINLPASYLLSRDFYCTKMGACFFFLRKFSREEGDTKSEGEGDWTPRARGKDPFHLLAEVHH